MHIHVVLFPSDLKKKNGVVSPEKYKEELIKQKRKDTILSEYFKRSGDDQKQALVELRIAFLQNEINSF